MLLLKHVKKKAIIVISFSKCLCHEKILTKHDKRIKQSLNLKSEMFLIYSGQLKTSKSFSCHQFKHNKLFAKPGEYSEFWDFNILFGH